MTLSQDSVEVAVGPSTDPKTDTPSAERPSGSEKPSWYGNVSLHNSALQTPMMETIH